MLWWLLLLWLLLLWLLLMSQVSFPNGGGERRWRGDRGAAFPRHGDDEGEWEDAALAQPRRNRVGENYATAPPERTNLEG